jgi:predicted  nucleic acid-binding Zn-ribbon protein
MREQIEILVKLQAIDSDIHLVNRRLGKVDDQKRRLESELDGARTLKDNLQTELDALQKTYRSLEADSSLNLSKVSASREKLSSVKTNKEYQSLLKEIDDIQAQNSKLEDQMLEILDQIDQFESQLAEKNRQFEAAEKRVAADKAEIEKVAAADRQKLAGLQENFKAVMETVTPDTLKVFQSVRSRVGNLTIAKVENAVCAGCHMNIPPQMYNELQRFEALMYCPHCQRLIYSEL